MSLAKCLKRLNLSQHEGAILRGAAKEHVELGHPANEAARLAVQSLIDDTQAELDDLVAQVGSKVPGLFVDSGTPREAAPAPNAEGPTGQSPPTPGPGSPEGTAKTAEAATPGPGKAETVQAAPVVPRQTFKTRLAATRARNQLGNTHKVQKVKGGFKLRAMSDGEQAAAQALGRRPRAGVDVTKDSLGVALAKLGGLNRESAGTDLGVHKDYFKTPGRVGQPLFPLKGGLTAEHAVEAMVETGHLLPGSTLSSLEDKLAAELGGDPQHSIAHDYAADAPQQRDDTLADFTPDELDAADYPAASPEVQALTEQMLIEAEALGIDTGAVREDAARSTEGQSDAEYQAAVQSALEGAFAEARANDARRDAQAARPGNQDDVQAAGDEAGAAEGLTLEAPTAEALQSAEDRATAAEGADSKEQARLKREADKARTAAELGDRTRQDASAEGFQLGQSKADVVKAMAGNGDLFAGKPSADFSQTTRARDLIAHHNLSIENLLHSQRIGGIAVPSLAITKNGETLLSFGEITLIAPSAMADPKGYAGAKVFGSDIYSPRYPEVSYKIGGAALKKLNAELAPFRDEGQRASYETEFRRLDDLTQRNDFKRWAAAKNNTTEAALTWDQKKAAAESLLRDIGADERIFKGFTNAGNRSYTPHTLDSVVAILKKNLRAGEGFNYGVGSLRAKYTSQFKSVEQIRQAKGRLVDKASFEAIKKDIDAELFGLVAQLEPHHPVSDRFGFADSVVATLQDAATMGLPRALRENGFNAVPADIQKDAAVFLGKLRALPTEYFEAKISRAVDLAEFAGAVVPANAPSQAIDALKARGVEVATYKSGDEDARRAAVQELAKRIDEKTGGGVLFTQGRNAGNSTVASTRAELATLFKGDTSNRITVLATAADLPDGVRERFEAAAGANAVTIDKQHVYLVADRIEQGTVRGAVMHELGVHVGMSPGDITRFTAQIEQWAKGNGPLSDMARLALKMRDDTASTTKTDEPVAYMVQFMVDAGWTPNAAPPAARSLLQRFFAAVKAALQRFGLVATNTTPQDLVDFAFGAAEQALRTPSNVAAADDLANPDIRFSEGNLADLARAGIGHTADLIEKVIGRDAPIAGQTTRQYTPEQTAAMKRVGFHVDPPALKDRVQALWKDAGKKMAQGLVDQFAPIKDISSTAYGLLRLSKGSSGAFEVFLNGGKLKLSDGVYDFDEKQRGGVIEKLLVPLQGEHHDFLRWVAANRAEQLKGVGKENLFSRADIDAIKSLAQGVASFDYTIQTGAQAGQVTRDRTLIYADSLRVFSDFQRNVMDMAEQSGLIDGAARSLWEHDFYVPFYRVTNEQGVAGMNIKSGVVRQEAFKMLKGGKEKLNADLLENTLMNWAHLLDASAKNRAAKATIEAAEKMGVATRMDSAGGKGGVWFRENGQQRWSMVDDPFVLTAITALDYAGMRNPVMNAMSAFKHVLTVGVTASPFFKVRNLIRDSVQAIAMSGLDWNAAKNVSEGWKLTAPNSDAYLRLLAGGGTIHFGTMLEGSEAKRVQALVESGVDSSTILGDEHKVKAFYRKFIEPGITAYNELGNRGEAVNRASLYAQLIRQGATHAEASLQARDLLDFSLQGSFTSIRFLSQVVPFFNARIQGLYKLGRAAKDDPRRFAAVAGAAAIASIALAAAYGDDDDWKKREDWDRDNYWWFKFGGTAFRIPKPFEIGAMATLAERSFELAFDKEMTGKRYRERVLSLLSNNLSLNPVPQLVKPLLDVYANKDAFTGRPIESMGMERLKPEYRFNGQTSMLARGLSTAANTATGAIGVDAPSPVQIDHLLRGYFGWLGSFVVSAGDILARPATGQPERATPDYWKSITGSMASNLSDAPSRYVTQMYSQAKEVEQAYATWRELLKEGKTQDAQAFFEANKADILPHRNLAAVKRREAQLNMRQKSIESDATMSGEQKREAIRGVQEQKDRVARLIAAGASSEVSSSAP